MNFGERKVRGRPRKLPVAGQRYLVSARLTPDVREQVEAAADRNGRSLAQEVELRVEQSFRDQQTLGSYDTAMLLRMLGSVIWEIERQSGRSWRDDYETALSVSAALQRVLLALSPSAPLSDQELPFGDLLDHGELDPETKKRLAEREEKLRLAYTLGDTLMLSALAEYPEKQQDDV